MKKNKNKKIESCHYLDGVYTKEEARHAIDEIQDTEVFYDLADEIWSESKYCEKSSVKERMIYKKEALALLKRVERMKPQYYIRKMMTVAAGIAVLIALSWGSYFLYNKIRVDQSEFAEVSTSFGEKKSVTLPDGTRVVLNSCSYIRYPKSFSHNLRNVSLEGEAYFRVKPNKKAPFIVDTEYFDVKVLGTSFNVKSYATDEIVSVSVKEGKVQVDMPEAMIRLKAHEEVIINAKSEEYNKINDERDVTAWVKGTLYFNHTPIRDVARELERVYNCTISFQDNQLFNNLISGEHDNKSLESVLQSIKIISGINYKINNRDVFLYK